MWLQVYGTNVTRRAMGLMTCQKISSYSSARQTCEVDRHGYLTATDVTYLIYLSDAYPAPRFSTPAQFYPLRTRLGCKLR